MSNYLVDVVDENNNLTGVRKPMFETHKKGLWHRTAHIWIYNSEGKVLLQLRASSKGLFPGMWDVSAAGHVDAGETPLKAALREVKEEVGIKAGEDDLRFFKVFKYKNTFRELVINEFFYVYFLKYDGKVSDLVLQEDEVSKVRFFSVDEIKGFLKNKGLSLAPHGDYWLEVLNELKT